MTILDSISISISMMPELYVYAVVFVFGSLIGSFLNVCIYRIPEKKSIAYPSSSCPSCSRPIRFYDNVPILSFILLRGRCRNCNFPISIKYPFVEFLGGAFSVMLYMRFALSAEFFVYGVLVMVLIAITFIDLAHRIIPDVISLPMIAFGFVATVVMKYPELLEGVLFSFTGIVVGGGVLLGVGLLYHLITGSEGMGGGDVKLLAMIGAFFGWKGVAFTLFMGSTFGALIGVAFMVVFGKKAKYALPFGPFLAIGALIYLFAGDSIIGWYIDRMWKI